MKKIRNILSLALVFIMLIGLMPMNVFAEETGTPATPAPVTAETPADPAKDPLKDAKEDPKEDPKEDSKVISTVNITSDIEDIFVVGKEATAPKLTAENVEITDFKWLKDGEASPYTGKFEDGVKYSYSFAIKATEGYKLADALTVNVGNNTLTYDSASKSVKSGAALAKAAPKVEPKPDKDKDKDKEKPDDKKPEDKPVIPTPAANVKVVTIGNGTASVDKPNATYLDKVTVTATPSAGYVVSKIYFYDNVTKTTTTIKNYGNGYYYGYNGRYYSDYYRFYDDFINNYSDTYSNYNDYLYYKHPSYYNKYDGYYDYYDYYRYYDRYYDKYYDRYYDDYYKYYSEFQNYNGYYSSYSEFLRNKYYGHYLKYDGYRYWDYRYDDDDYRYWYNRYYYGGVNYTVNNSFTMPASNNVTVYVEFTDWSYYGYYYGRYYDDYYYYRARRDKKAEEAKAKEEQAKKEEEEAKAKAEAAKTPEVYENKAVITIGSNVLDKVSRNVHTVHQMDSPAYVKDGRVMLPLRYVAEALGLQVSWVANTKTVVIWDLTQRVEIPVKSNRIIVNGITYTSDVKPEIKNERTMLPIANIARALGLVDGSDIYWDQYNKQVTLTRKVLSK